MCRKSPMSAMADETFCSSCQKISLHSLFYGQYDPKNRSIFFGRLKKIFNKDNCRLCRFIRDILVDHYRKDYVERKLGAGHDQNIWLYQNAIDLHFDEAAKRSKVKKTFYLQIGCISVVSREGSHFRREDMRNDDELTRDWVMPSIFALKHLPQEESDLKAGKSLEKTIPDHRGRLVDCRKIDWGLINQWDSACSHHAGLTPGKELNPNLRSNFRDRLRVIDIEQACVIACPPNASYVALSYQWGSDQKLKLKKANISMLETPGYFSTPEGEPARTIRDSMIVVKRLGYRYLWVDALCIQDDTENVIMNVDQMDQIYQGAHLTVVAAAGKDAYHGLPGVTPETPRSEGQLRIMINGTWISSMLESSEGAINFSRWITRAWTCKCTSRRRGLFQLSSLLQLTDHLMFRSGATTVQPDSLIYEISGILQLQSRMRLSRAISIRSYGRCNVYGSRPNRSL
ncbi:HET-domain-containing protein [Corynespora cassiicola Philippines]|uniref:HET-domain-containing protein n=1 Tax=Corynespora cassiicola Philippines TaxID=1448308 RepID=A0A2T2NF64_CORCC|nr:HET-domain-containing protein [Corynespora cassiicola Philippines]